MKLFLLIKKQNKIYQEEKLIFFNLFIVLIITF